MAIAHPSLSIHDDDSAPLQRQDLLQAIAVVHSTVSISEHRKGHVQFGGELLRFCSTPAANDQNLCMMCLQGAVELFQLRDMLLTERTREFAHEVQDDVLFPNVV